MPPIAEEESNRFEQLLKEETTIQSACAKLEYPEHGMPTCVQLFDLQLSCLCKLNLSE